MLAFDEKVRQAARRENLVMIEAIRVRFPHHPPNPQAAEPHRRSCRRKHHHPLCENLSPLPDMRQAMRQAPLPVHKERWPTCPGRQYRSPFTCVPEGSSAKRRPATGRSSRSVYPGRSTTTADEHKRLHEWFTHFSFAHVERHSSDGCVGVCRQSNSSYK